MPNFDDLLTQVWPFARARHYYPELPAPRMAAGNERVGLEMKGKRISISAAFVTDMARQMNPRLVLAGLLDHAIAHYLYCPWDFATHVTLYKEAKTIIADSQLAKRAADAFMDVVADTNCVSRFETPLTEMYRHLPKNRLESAVCALYQLIWGVDLGVNRYADIAAKLARIPYLDRTRWTAGMRRFAAVVQELLEEEESDGEAANQSRMGNHDLERYSPQEIEEGLNKLAAEAADPKEFEAIVQDLQEDLVRALGNKGQTIGLGKGGSGGADILYYMKLARSYALPVRKRLMEKSGALYPHHHVPWEASQPFNDIDPWKSFGKVMPGLTKSWLRIEGEMYGREYGTPDCIVSIDSSGSMIDPGKKLSHAVLGAACAAEAYMRNNARVAVYNFSDASAGDEFILPYTRNRQQMYGALCSYFGGGTRLSLKTLRSLQAKGRPDIFMITDMQITNLENLIRYFNECRNRITAVLVGQNKHINRFREKMVLQRNVQIYGIEKLEDIPEIVLGQIREYLYTS